MAIGRAPRRPAVGPSGAGEAPRGCCGRTSRASPSSSRAAGCGTRCSTSPTPTSRPRPRPSSSTRIARAINRGWICPVSYGSVAQAGWIGVTTRVTPTGQVEGTCVGTTLASDHVYYYNRPQSVYADARLRAGAPGRRRDDPPPAEPGRRRPVQAAHLPLRPEEAVRPASAVAGRGLPLSPASRSTCSQRAARGARVISRLARARRCGSGSRRRCGGGSPPTRAG